MVSTTFLLSMGTYLMGCTFFTYFCMIADPNESRLAYLLSIELPDKLTSKLGKLIGPKYSKHFANVYDYSLLCLYLVIVGGSWFVIFAVVYPRIDASTTVSNVHKYIGLVVCASCFQSWRFASGKSPGIITARSIPKYENYPYDNALFVEGRICPTYGIPKLPRSKFDRYTELHIARFDHFCGWLHNPIGEENYRWFLLFLLVHIGMCIYGFVICGYLFLDEVKEKRLWEVTFYNAATNTKFSADLWIVMQFLVQRNQMLSSVFFLMGVMVITLGMFLGYHCWITSRGMTTNETFKWSELKQWHQRETKIFNEAVKAGLVIHNTISITKPELGDGDVTCTGAASKKENEVKEEVVEEQERPPVSNPGPMPTNIYNNGFIENWKDIIFPRSLRAPALERYRLSLSREPNEQKENSFQSFSKEKSS